MHSSTGSNAFNATGLFHAGAGGDSSAAAIKGRVLAQAEAASEETGVERAVKRALRGVADLVRSGRMSCTHPQCVRKQTWSLHRVMAVRQALCRIADSPQCDCAGVLLRCNALADNAGAGLQGRRLRVSA